MLTIVRHQRQGINDSEVTDREAVDLQSLYLGLGHAVARLQAEDGGVGFFLCSSP